MGRMELERYWFDNFKLDCSKIETRFNELVEEFVINKADVPDNDVFFNHISSEIEKLITKEIYDGVYSKADDLTYSITLLASGNPSEEMDFFKLYLSRQIDELIQSNGLPELIKSILSDFYWDKHKELEKRGIIDKDGELVGRVE